MNNEKVHLFAIDAYHALNEGKKSHQRALRSYAKMMACLANKLRELGIDGDQADQLAYVLSGAEAHK